MQIDKKTLDRLLKLNDDQLRLLLSRLLAEYGVDPAAVPLAGMDVGKLREVLSSATDEDIGRFMQLLGAAGLGKSGGGAP